MEIISASSTSSAIFATRPDKLKDKPKVFVGRIELFKQVYALLEQHEQVLLQGFGGMGKTALAATLADQWIADNKGSVIWLKAGTAGVDALFEALARSFDQQQAIASLTGTAKTDKVNDLLYDCHATLLVLDDCWSGKDLFAFLKAVPSDMAVLVTARQRYPLSKICEVDELDPPDALLLLAQHAGQTFTPPTPSVGTRHDVSVAGDGLPTASTETQNVTPSSLAGRVGVGLNASALCDLLGNHAFAVEIAGKTLKVHGWTPADLIQHIKDAPDKLTMPLELSESGRENVAKLLEVSLNALDDTARNVFLAFGAFFAPQTTPEMLQLYFDGTSNSPRHEGEAASDVSERGVTVAQGLDTLHLHSLVERFPATNTGITAYRTHDLAYSYARAQATDDQRQRALNACLSYTEHYNQPSPLNFAALRPELDNFLGAATWAFEHEHYSEVERFAWNLYEYSKLLDYGGFYSEATRLLQQAAEAAGRAGGKQNQAIHLGNLGLVYGNLGQTEKAIAYHEQALAISRDIGDKGNEDSQLSNLGMAYHSLGQVEKAIAYYGQALAISRDINDKRNGSKQLGNLGVAYFDLGQVEKAIAYYGQALAISRDIGDIRNGSNQLGNLGMAYYTLGQTEKAIDYYEQALAISRDLGDKRNRSYQLGNLGLAYYTLGQTDKAIDHYEQALAISREIADRRNQGNQLINLGVASLGLEQPEQAIEYFEQALTISRDIGDKRNEGNTLSNLGLAYHTLGQVEKAIVYHEQGLTINREIGLKRGESSILGNLGLAYHELGQVEKAVSYYQQAITICRDLGDQLGQARNLMFMGLVYEDQQDFSGALQQYQEARTLFANIGAQHLLADLNLSVERVQASMNVNDTSTPDSSS